MRINEIIPETTEEQDLTEILHRRCLEEDANGEADIISAEELLREMDETIANMRKNAK